MLGILCRIFSQMRWYIVTGVDMKDECPELATLPGLAKTETNYCIRWKGHRGLRLHSVFLSTQR